MTFCWCLSEFTWKNFHFQFYFYAHFKNLYFVCFFLYDILCYFFNPKEERNLFQSFFFLSEYVFEYVNGEKIAPFLKTFCFGVHKNPFLHQCLICQFICKCVECPNFPTSAFLVFFLSSLRFSPTIFLLYPKPNNRCSMFWPSLYQLVFVPHIFSLPVFYCPSNNFSFYVKLYRFLG